MMKRGYSFEKTKEKKGLYAFSVAFILLIASAISAPILVAQEGEKGFFGVFMGDNLDKYDRIRNKARTIYQLNHAPKPLEDFYGYIIRYHESTGVCMVTGTSRSFRSESNGTQLKEKFQEIVGRLKPRLGNARLSDYVIKGSTRLWSEHFMTKLVAKEGVLAAKWDHYSKATLSDDIKEVLLLAAADTGSEGFFHLQVKFNNYDSCINAMKIDEQSDKRNLRTLPNQ